MSGLEVVSMILLGLFVLEISIMIVISISLDRPFLAVFSDTVLGVFDTVFFWVHRKDFEAEDERVRGVKKIETEENVSPEQAQYIYDVRTKCGKSNK